MTVRKGSGNELLCCRRTVVNGREQLVFETSAGQRITLQDGPPSIAVEDSSGNRVTLEARGITVSAAAKITLNASLVEINAGVLTVNAGSASFSGTLEATTVIAANLLPGAGNVW